MPRNITLPPLTDYVSLADVPLLLAQSIDRKDCEDPELFQAFDAIAYEKEVKDAVLLGQLLPRSPDTLIPIPQACGEQLRTAVVTVANLAEFVKQRYEGLVQVEGGTTGERIMAQEATKKENGRYTLEEAAAMLAEHAGMRLESTLSKLIEAVEREELPVYEPGRNETYQPKTVREFYEEAYWNDLNAWLSDNEARISWKFPSPSPRHSAKNQSSALPDGVPSAEIVEKFRLNDKWNEKLRKPDSYKYLLNALVERGGRGKTSHRWNPAKIGSILIERNERNALSVTTVITRQFPKWLDEWEKLSVEPE